MVINVQGYAEFYPIGLSVTPLTYKTAVFNITNGTSISEIYDYFNDNPTIYWLRSNNIQGNWGDQKTGPVVGYTQVDNTWELTALPGHPIVLRWDIVETERSDGTGTTPICDIITPTNNTTHYDA